MPVSQAIRRRELASDRRAGSWARAEARRRQRAWVRKQWRRLTVAAAVVLLATLAALLLVHNGFLQGLLLGAGLTGGCSVIVGWIVLITGTGPTMMGDLGEQLTAGELRPLQRKGWLLVNHFMLRATADIDHVLVGPGGAYAVETKWSATPWDLSGRDPRILSAVRQAQDNAGVLSLWADFKSVGVTVSPLVILWGSGLSELAYEDSVRNVAGATVVAGPHLARWRAGLPQEQFDQAAVEGAWRAMERHLAKRSHLNVSADAVPASVLGGVLRGIATITTALVAFVVSGELLGHVRPLALSAALVTSLLLAGVPARRLPGAWLPTLGWIAGSSSALLILAWVRLNAVVLPVNWRPWGR